MTRKEVQAAIDANPGKPLYIQYSGSTRDGAITIGFFSPCSKTTALRNAKVIAKTQTGRHGDFRLDLRPSQYQDLDQQILLFTVPPQIPQVGIIKPHEHNHQTDLCIAPNQRDRRELA